MNKFRSIFMKNSYLMLKAKWLIIYFIIDHENHVKSEFFFFFEFNGIKLLILLSLLYKIKTLFFKLKEIEFFTIFLLIFLKSLF